MRARETTVPAQNPRGPARVLSWPERLNSPGGISVLLALATLAVFFPVVHFQFINYDDQEYVYENAFVQSGLNWPALQWAFTTSHASNWHPLTWISHMLDWQIYGSRAGGHHATNQLFHGLNSLLLFRSEEHTSELQSLRHLVCRL